MNELLKNSLRLAKTRCSDTLERVSLQLNTNQSELGSSDKAIEAKYVVHKSHIAGSLRDYRDLSKHVKVSVKLYIERMAVVGEGVLVQEEAILKAPV